MSSSALSRRPVKMLTSIHKYFSCLHAPQLISVQKHLKRENNVESTMAQLNRLNELRGEKSKTGSSGSGGAGLKNTWKRLKGKKKKQRNLTAPEISPQSLQSAVSLSSSSSGKKMSADLAPVKESEGESTIGKENGKRSGSKDKLHAIKHQDSDNQKPATSSPSHISAKSRNRKSSLGSREEFHRAESRSSVEDTSLSQKSDLRFSDEHSVGDKTTPSHTGSSKVDLVLSQPTDCSQASAKLSHSQSENFVTHEDHLSTQSSSDVNIQLSPLVYEQNQFLDGEQAPAVDIGFLSNSHLTLTEKEQREMMERDFTKGSPSIYTGNRDKQHTLNLKRVQEFLESSGEMEPVDLSLIRDWDGWVMASREIV